MKSRLGLVLSIILCFFVSFGFLAQAEEFKHAGKGIMATGEAQVWIEPDSARIFLGIETMSNMVVSARGENAQKIKQVMKALKELNIEGMLVKAPSYNVSIVKESEFQTLKLGQMPKVLGYKVRQDFTVLLKNKDAQVLSQNAAQVIDAALNNGVNIITDVVFFKEDDSADKRDALTLALKNAMANAKVMADTVGVAIKSYDMISSITKYPSPFMVHNALMSQQYTAAEGMVGRGTTLLAGKISVSAEVTINCAIESTPPQAQ